MSRVYNFSAGPSMLPLEVLETAAKEMTDYNGSGMSVMEMSHRSKAYESIINDAFANLRAVLNIPENYKIIFMQGGASTQFAAVPLNLMNKNNKADYIVSGQFSGKAYKEAQKYGDVKEIASSKDKNFTYIPKITREDIRPDADYVHICYNNTIYGTHFDYIPDTGDIPLVADMSSCILSEPIDITKFGMIYAGAQKNMAPAGVTVVIIREDLLGNARPDTPVMLDYKTLADNDSMYNTPPCYSIYVLGLVCKWIQNLGGVNAMNEINKRKAKVLYDYLDNSKLFKPTANKEVRSIMNVCFVTGNEEMDADVCKKAAAAGLVSIKGHRSVGGMRASIYNAMPEAGVDALVEFLKKYEEEHI